MEPKKLIICLSGKRFSGKTHVSSIIQKYLNSLNFTVSVNSLSFYCKKEYCKFSGADIDKMINDHEYKNNHRDALTEYFLSTDPLTYPKLLEHDIQNTNFDIYIIDDMRLLVENAQYFKKYWSNKWNLVYIRINTTDETKINRGWVHSDYDNQPCENELDNYTDFDYVINNDGTLMDLYKIVTEILTNIINCHKETLIVHDN